MHGGAEQNLFLHVTWIVATVMIHSTALLSLEIIGTGTYVKYDVGLVLCCLCDDRVYSQTHSVWRTPSGQGASWLRTSHDHVT